MRRPRVLAALTQHGGRALYAHTFNRFEFYDHDFLAELRALGLRCTEVWPLPEHTTVTTAPVALAGGPQGGPAGGGEHVGEEWSFSGELFPEFRVAVLEIERQMDSR